MLQGPREPGERDNGGRDPTRIAVVLVWLGEENALPSYRLARERNGEPVFDRHPLNDQTDVVVWQGVDWHVKLLDFFNAEKSLKKMKSDYEKQRDANVERNLAVLAALGLAEDNALKPKPKPAPVRREREPTPIIPEEERRRSSRVSKQPVTLHALSNEFFDAEERDANKKTASRRECGSRKRSAPLSFQEEQQREAAEREARAAERREQLERLKRATEARQALAMRPQSSFPAQSGPLAADLPVVDEHVSRPAHQFNYPTLSKRARCPHCSGVFVITGKGTLHKHDCVVRTGGVVAGGVVAG